MASNLAKAIDRGEIYCTINSTPRKSWRDFTLQPGHIFGYSPELKTGDESGLFVLYQVMDDYLVLYTAKKTPDKYAWRPVMVDFGSDTADRIVEVLRRRVGGVVTDKYNIAGVYNPKIVTGAFMPMPYMRIPMGRRGGTVLAEVHEPVPAQKTSACSADEFKQKRVERRVAIAVKRAENARR